MARVLLRSGCLNDFHAVGNHGQAVFESALQIREGLRLQGLANAAGILAIPETDDTGQRIDWYAPSGGRVVSWLSADDAARRQAFKLLEKSLSDITALSERSQRAAKPALRRFGLLLARALMFPGANHVFLVDGRPVVTFWGFITHHQKIPDDIFADLRSVQVPAADIHEPEPVVVVQAEPVNTQTALAAQCYEEIATVAAVAEEDLTPASPPRRKLARCIMSAIATVLLFVAGASYYAFTILPVQDVPPPAIAPAVITPAPVKLLPEKSTLPLALATVIDTPPPPGALVLPADALRMGSTDFMNGIWQISGEERAPVAQPTALSPLRAITLNITNNRGAATLILDDNQTCNTDVVSGLMPSGALLVKSRAQARCSDGSRYPVPEIACRQGETGVARCEARYNDEETQPLIFKKMSK